TTYTYHAEGRYPCVGFDNVAVAGKAAGHFMDLGHTRIAMVAGITRDNDRAGERVEGFKAALASAGLDLPPGYLIEKPYNVAAGREALRSLIALDRPPTAVFCASDVLAFGVLVECTAKGIDVPGRMSVIGFDNLELCAHFPPG